MRLSCNFVNVYTISCTRLYARIPNIDSPNPNPDSSHRISPKLYFIIPASDSRCVGKGKGLLVYSDSQTCLTATGTHLPYGITRCYLPPGRGDIPAFTPANQGWYSIQRPWRDARLGWLNWLRCIWRRYTRLKKVTHPSTNRAQRRATSFMRRTTLPLRQTINQRWSSVASVSLCAYVCLSVCLSVRL